MDSVMSVYKPHGGHSCGHSHNAGAGGGHGHSHGGGGHAHGAGEKHHHAEKEPGHVHKDGDKHVHKHDHSKDANKGDDDITEDNQINSSKDKSGKKDLESGKQSQGLEGGEAEFDYMYEGGEDGHPRQETNINIRAAVVHVIGDMLQSIGVIIAAILIDIWPEAKVADPICTYLFSILVMMTTIPVFRDCMRILMEVQPNAIDSDHLRQDVLEV